MSTEDFLKRLLSYDPSTRRLQAPKQIGNGLGCSSLEESIELLETAREILRCSEEQLARELAEWVRFRVLFCLVPEECLHGDQLFIKPAIRSHLQAMDIESPSPDLISGLKTLCENFRRKKSPGKKMGISDVRVKHQHLYVEIMRSQNERCSYCGVKLHFGDNVDLDHVLPYHLGDDPSDGSNWQFLCKDCNVGKAEYPHYTLTSAVNNWVGPQYSTEITARNRFAALCRDRCCTRCDLIPSEGELHVVKVVDSGCGFFDNLMSVCVDEDGCKLRTQTSKK